MITRSLEKAQTRIEELNFDARKHVLAYDDILNIQRKTIYERRRAILTGGDAAIDDELAEISLGDETLVNVIDEKKNELGENFYPSLRHLLLQAIDFLWVEHLEAMEYLRSSVNLRAYGQRDPLVEYKKEGLRLFQNMEETYRSQLAATLPNIGAAAPQQTQNERVIHSAAKTISAISAPVGKQRFDRNDKVRITNGTETQELKFKKAEPLLKTGHWRIVE